MNRVFNFSAGPSCLPLDVLEVAQKEVVCYKDTGMSVMEMSHRSKSYEDIIFSTEALLRELMNVPSNYKILFLQGGASLQFSMIPLNLFKNKKADFINTGVWSTKAISEAKKYGVANVVASSKDSNFNCIPDYDESTFSKNADYFHITSNNTIYGTKYVTLPDTKDVPLVADMSSFILSEVVDVSKYGIIYAGAQKNIGIAGLTVVIIRDDLIRELDNFVPTMLSYKTHAENDSLYNTPPAYAIYITKLVLEHVKKTGGVTNMQKVNEQKAKLLYDCIDNSKLYKGTANKRDRSLMNIPFVTGNEELDKKFIKQAEAHKLFNLKGYRTVGGMRASIYNAMTLDGVNTLVDFMTKFEKENL